MIVLIAILAVVVVMVLATVAAAVSARAREDPPATPPSQMMVSVEALEAMSAVLTTATVRTVQEVAKAIGDQLRAPALEPDAHASRSVPAPADEWLTRLLEADDTDPTDSAFPSGDRATAKLYEPDDLDFIPGTSS